MPELLEISKVYTYNCKVVGDDIKLVTGLNDKTQKLTFAEVEVYGRLPNFELATETWYEFRDYFDFETYSFTTNQQEKAQMFIQTIWKKATKVGFAIQDNFVLAFYDNRAEDIALKTPAALANLKENAV